MNVLNFLTLLHFFSNKMLVIRAGIHKCLVRIANREDPDQTRPFSQATRVRNFRAFTVSSGQNNIVIWY